MRRNSFRGRHCAFWWPKVRQLADCTETARCDPFQEDFAVFCAASCNMQCGVDIKELFDTCIRATEQRQSQRQHAFPPDTNEATMAASSAETPVTTPNTIEAKVKRHVCQKGRPGCHPKLDSPPRRLQNRRSSTFLHIALTQVINPALSWDPAPKSLMLSGRAAAANLPSPNMVRAMSAPIGAPSLAKFRRGSLGGNALHSLMHKVTKGCCRATSYERPQTKGYRTSHSLVENLCKGVGAKQASV